MHEKKAGGYVWDFAMTRMPGGSPDLDYELCQYGESRVKFRGPMRPIVDNYIAFLGGSETFGRFIETPFPALVERKTNINCLNLGVANSGLDIYLNEASVLDIAARARLCVVQVLGAHNMSNRFFTVHPRRNDRFLAASETMEQLYPEVDFTDFSFTRHLMRHLAQTSPERFQDVLQELREAWTARMRLLLRRLEGRAIVLWFADHTMPDAITLPEPETTLFVTRGMMRSLAPHALATVEVVESDAARNARTDGMLFNDLDACAAAEMMGPVAHEDAAAVLADVIRKSL